MQNYKQDGDAAEKNYSLGWKAMAHTDDALKVCHKSHQLLSLPMTCRIISRACGLHHHNANNWAK